MVSFEGDTMKLVIAFASLVVPFAIAAADQPRHRHPPPAEAVDACAKSRQGDACAFSIHDHRVTGICQQLPDTTTLACKPDRPPPPPPEAIDACAEANEGAPCTFEHRDRAVRGTCAKGPDAGAPLACRPARR
jgi:hypothetical protein